MATNPKRAIWMKARRAARKLEHMCIECGADAGTFSRCVAHRQKRSNEQRAYRIRHVGDAARTLPSLVE